MLVNNVGPYSNPAETYDFYTLPYCPPKELAVESENLGECWAGDRRQSSLYDLRFRGLCPCFACFVVCLSSFFFFVSFTYLSRLRFVLFSERRISSCLVHLA